MKLFYRMNLKDHPTGVQDLWHDVALWHKELREIFRPALDQTRQVPAPIIESLENQRQAILSGKAQGGFTDYTQPWLDLQARTGAINHLFTYGTLMTGQRAHRQLTAHPGCQLVGTAILRGFCLYDLGAFPAILPAGPGDCPAGDDWPPGPETSGRSRGPALVIGEVYRINHDQLADLDAYEGEGSLYLRRAAVVETIAGQRELAWIYIYNQPLDPAREVSLGLQPWNGEPFLQFANRYVWYVAYGSNLLRERFLCYIRGGWFREIRSYDGCRDQNLPIIDLPCQLPYVMYFGNQSATWQGGGVAFLDASQKGKSQGRAYLITRDQFNDIHRQEGRSADWYDRRLDLGHLSGIPVATFTNHGRRPEHEPSQQYLAVVREGIAELQGRAIP